MLQSDPSTTDDVGASDKEVVAMKIGSNWFDLKVNFRLTMRIELKRIDWNTLINLGTFLATLYGALK